MISLQQAAFNTCTTLLTAYLFILYFSGSNDSHRVLCVRRRTGFQCFSDYNSTDVAEITEEFSVCIVYASIC